MATSIFRQNFPGVTLLQEAVDSASFIIGLDLHKKTTAVCVVDPRQPAAPVFQRKRIRNEELLATLQRFPGPKVVSCEAAYGWILLGDALADLSGVTLIPLDPRKTSSWIASSGIKGDGLDAQVLCHACLHGGVATLAVHRRSRESRECCMLARSREQLVRQRTRLRNQLTSLERDCGPNPYTGEIPAMSPLLSTVHADLTDALRHAGERVRKMEEQMVALSKEDAVIALLQSIPGIGPVTAFALRHIIETVDRFADPSHLSSYIGFGIRQWQSGESFVKGKITKTGNALLRKLLVQGAQVLRFRCPDLVPLYFPQLGDPGLMRDRRHANKVVCALARKNLTFAWHIWKKGTSFDLERYRERRQTMAFTDASARPSPKAAELVLNSAREGRSQV